ncbi:hypothetical protein QCA50_014405 [Cerrena zonata]|uniref:C2H2-type domain-containing protein n=1 Tax=Cerrena zonata TaxID=2478898 RepID=A0AAW0FMQ2_9APHY
MPAIRYKLTHFEKAFKESIIPAAFNKLHQTYFCRKRGCNYRSDQRCNFRDHTKKHFDFHDIRCEYPSLHSSFPNVRCRFMTRNPGSYCRHSKRHKRIGQVKSFSRDNDPDVTTNLQEDVIRELSGFYACPSTGVKPQVSHGDDTLWQFATLALASSSP